MPGAANENDCTMFNPTLQAVVAQGLLADLGTVHLDRGYDTASVRAICTSLGVETVTAKTRLRGLAKSKKAKLPVPLGMRWPVERTNSWLSNFGQLRRNTDRYSCHRESALSLAAALIITIKLTKWAKRWQSMAVAYWRALLASIHRLTRAATSSGSSGVGLGAPRWVIARWA